MSRIEFENEQIERLTHERDELLQACVKALEFIQHRENMDGDDYSEEIKPLAAAIQKVTA